MQNLPNYLTPFFFVRHIILMIVFISAAFCLLFFCNNENTGITYGLQFLLFLRVINKSGKFQEQTSQLDMMAY